MSISDRLDEIRARIVRAREGRQTDRYMVLDVDAPEILAAVRAVLELHQPWWDKYCAGCDDRWPCATRRAITAALGEES